MLLLDHLKLCYTLMTCVGELKHLVKASRQLVNMRFFVSYDEILTHTILINDVCLDKFNHVLLLHFL